MAKRPTQQRAPSDALPGSLPDTTPNFGVAPDHNFTLQMIMELQKSTGQISESIRHLTSTVEKLDSKLDGTNKTLSSVTHKMYGASAVVLVLLAIGGFILNAAWGLASDQIKAALNSSSAQTHQQQSVATPAKKSP